MAYQRCCTCMAGPTYCPAHIAQINLLVYLFSGWNLLVPAWKERSPWVYISSLYSPREHYQHMSEILLLILWNKRQVISMCIRPKYHILPPNLSNNWMTAVIGRFRHVTSSVPSKHKYLYNIHTTSAQHLRRWSNIVFMLYKCFVFVGYVFHRSGVEYHTWPKLPINYFITSWPSCPIMTFNWLIMFSSELKIETVLETLTTQLQGTITGSWMGDTWRTYFMRLPNGLHKVTLLATRTSQGTSGVAVDDIMIMPCSEMGNTTQHNIKRNCQSFTRARCYNNST